jgi:type II secretory pathway pseudopilin PulG
MIKLNNIKKGAMFGLDALIKKLCHTGLDPVSHALNNKHGAMFGLDARIALAIFGALSVISGAALYSAIQQAKAVQWQTYFNELTKASEAYYLDTGRQIPLTSDTTRDDEYLLLSINVLVINEDNIENWKGPYWQDTIHYTGVNDYYIRDNMTQIIDSDSAILLSLRQTSDWSTDIDSGVLTNELCDLNSTDCAEWWVINASAGTANVLKVFNLLDEKVDGGDGAYTGNIRYSTFGSNYLFVKGRPRVYK